MKTDTQLRIERARELGIFYDTGEKQTMLSCGCGYKGPAKVIAYTEYDPEEFNYDEVICPECGDS